MDANKLEEVSDVEKQKEEVNIPNSNENGNQESLRIKDGKQNTFQEVNPHCPSNFGFEPKEGIEIYFKDNADEAYHYGLANGEALLWTPKGECYRADIRETSKEQYNLTPKVKHWYEDESNFPKLGFYTDSLTKKEVPTLAFHFISDSFTDEFERPICLLDEFKPATKEELLSLLVQDAN